MPSLGAYFPWLRPQQGGKVKLRLPEIFVIGLQECKKAHRSHWLRAIRDSIDDAVSQNATAQEDNAAAALSGRHTAYKLVSSVHMVQMSLYVFAAAANAREITDVRTENVPTGLGGVYGNKGAVAVGIQYRHGTRIAFVSSHLAARVQRVSYRASDYREITGRLRSLQVPGTRSQFTVDANEISAAKKSVAAAAAASVADEDYASSSSGTRESFDSRISIDSAFAPGAGLDDLNGNGSGAATSAASLLSYDKSSSVSLQPLDGYDHVFWLGDLNYRVHIKGGPGCDTPAEYEMVQKLIEEREFETLAAHDQLRRDMNERRVFCGFKEQNIRFAPTYRMKKGTAG